MNLSVRAGLAGVAAAAVALGVAEIVAVWTGPLSAPLLAVGGVVVDNVPAPVKDFGVQVFGTHDKTALISGTAILLAAYAFAVGVVAKRWWWVALGGIAVFGLVGVAAAVTRHDAGVFAALPSLIGVGLAVPVLRHLLGLAGVGAPAAAAWATLPGAKSGGKSRVAIGGKTKVATGGKSSGATGGKSSGATGGKSSGATGGKNGGATGGKNGGATGGKNGGATGGKSGGGVTTLGGPGGRSTLSPQAGDGLASDLAGAPGAGRRNAVGGGVESYGKESRRRFLKGVGIAGGVALLSGVIGRWLTAREAVSHARAAVALPTPVQSTTPLPAGVQVAGATPYVSSNDDFYRIDTSLYPPQVDPGTWQLKIHGMVRNPITITWAELLKLPMVERYVTLACVSNEVGGDLIGNALWLGVPIKALLDQAGPLPGADQVIQRSVDGWTCGSPTAALMDGRDALLAIGMNGEPLPVEHGFPVRMVVPGLYGYVSACKWITEIEVSRFADFDAYWVPRGWSQQAPIKTESRIDTPNDGAKRKAGPVVVAGVAWAQHRGIAKVEVQIDGDPWVEATLAPTVSSDTWREWSYAWVATKGSHSVRVRATDRDGQAQTSTPAPPAPDGATGWHSVRVDVD